MARIGRTLHWHAPSYDRYRIGLVSYGEMAMMSIETFEIFVWVLLTLGGIGGACKAWMALEEILDK